MKKAQRPAIEELRARIRAIERGGGEGARTSSEASASETSAAVLSLGVLDEYLPEGGLPLAGLHEIAGARDEWDDGVAAGFCLALLGRLAAARPGLLLWVARRPDLYAPGIAALGFDPSRLILACPGSGAEALWAMEEGLRASALAAVAGEVAAPDATAARRLQLAAEAAGRPCFLLRRRLYATRRTVVAGPALTRWRVTALPSAEDGPGTARAMPGRWPTGLPDRPRWRIELLRCRGAAPQTFDVEWDDAAGDFALVAGVRGRALAPAAAAAAG
jgi:protein ImuA